MRKKSGNWRKGAPPSVGWWPASAVRVKGRLRWWDGRFWSVSVEATCPAKKAAQRAKLRAFNSSLVEWHDRPADWPEASKT